jgi:TPR repeat protein
MNNTRNECKSVEENGVNIDVESLRKLAEQGDGKAQHLLATMDLDEDWSYYPINDPNFAAGLEWVRKDADAGNPISQYQYGEILIWACDIEKTMNKGLEYLKRSCENGYGKAGLELGLLYENSMGFVWDDVFQPDLKEAIKWYKKGAALGNIFAHDRLRRLHCNISENLLVDEN